MLARENNPIFYHNSFREALKPKKRLVMEFFCKGLTPPPHYFRKLWNPWGTFNFGHKKVEKTKFPQNTKNGHIYNKLFRKTAQKCPYPYILHKKVS